MPKFIQYIDKVTGKKLWMWDGYVGINPVTRKKYTTSRRGFRTKSEAKDHFLKTQNELKQKGINPNDMTLESLLRSFFKYKEDKVKESTLANYTTGLKSLYKREIIQPNKKIKSFTVPYCNHLYELIKDSGLKKPSWYLGILNTVFNYAVRMELLESNPFSKVDKTEKQTNKEKSKVFTVDQLNAFIRESRNLNDPLYFYFFSLLARTGMRQGEARALYWSDINFKDNTISISKTITTNRNKKSMMGDTPKTSSSDRVIAMDNGTKNLLLEWKNTQSKFNNMIGLPIGDSLVFTNQNKGILNCSTLLYSMKLACKNANVPYITMHGLRHTYITLALESGSQPIDIAHTVGHDDMSMIMKVYDSMTNNRRQNVADNFSRLVGEF